MLIGVYLLAPVVMLFKDSISYEMFRRVSVVFFIMASFSRWTGSVTLNWDVGQSFEYLGYFMVGYILRRDSRKNNGKGILLIILGILFEIATAMEAFFIQFLRIIDEDDLMYTILEVYCSSIISTVAALLIFAGFSMLIIKGNKCTRKLAKMSFIIYLFHAGVWDFLKKLLCINKGSGYILAVDCTYGIPICTAIVLIISILLTIVYERFTAKFMPKVRSRFKLLEWFN